MLSQNSLADENEQKQFLKLSHVVSSIGITFLSSNAVYWSLSDSGVWMSANIVDSIFRFCIPVFFMMPGITLLESVKVDQLKPYFKSRFLMSVLPYVFWSLVGLVFNVFYLKSVSPDQVTDSYVINGLLNGSLFAIFWFFIPLFGIELSMPIFAGIEQDKRKKIFSYLFIAGLVCNIAIPFFIEVFHFDFDFPIRVLSIAGYLVYLPASWMVANYDFTKKQKIIVFALGIVSLLAMIFGTQILSLKEGAINTTYKGYLSLPTFVYSFAFFLGLKEIAPKVMSHPKINKILSVMVNYTFCFYLMHKFLFEIIQRTFDLNVYSALYRFGMPFLCFPIVMGITWLIRKIPGLRRVAP